MVSFKTTKTSKVAGSVTRGTTGRSSFSAKQPAGDPGWSKTFVKEDVSQKTAAIKPVTLKSSTKFTQPVSTETIRNRVQNFSMTLSKKPAAPKTQLSKNIKNSGNMILSRKSDNGIGQGTTIVPQGSLKILTAKTSSFKAKKV